MKPNPPLLAAAVALAAVSSLALAGRACAAGYVGLTGPDGRTPVPVDAAGDLDVNCQLGCEDPVPQGAAQVVASSGNKANAAATATLAGAAGKTTYIAGFQATGAGATSANPQNLTVTDGTWTLTFVSGAGAQDFPLIVRFPYPIAASAQNTAITVTLPASGSGGSNAAVSAEGFQR